MAWDLSAINVPDMLYGAGGGAALGAGIGALSNPKDRWGGAAAGAGIGAGVGGLAGYGYGINDGLSHVAQEPRLGGSDHTLEQTHDPISRAQRAAAGNISSDPVSEALRAAAGNISSDPVSEATRRSVSNTNWNAALRNAGLW